MYSDLELHALASKQPERLLFQPQIIQPAFNGTIGSAMLFCYISNFHFRCKFIPQFIILYLRPGFAGISVWNLLHPFLFGRRLQQRE